MTHPAAITLVPMIQANLGDIRMLSIQLFIEKLIERSKYGGGVDRYRIKNTTTGNFITSLADFTNAITPQDLDLSYPYTTVDEVRGDRVTGVEVTPLNLEIQFNRNSGDDAFFSTMYDVESDKGYKVIFHMAYMNDSGTDTPVMKIYHIRLVRKT